MQTGQAPAPVVVADATPSATVLYQAAISVRQELRNQLDALVSQRHGYLRELEDHNVQGAATSGMQQRIVQIDQRIAETDKLLEGANAQVAKVASIPGAVTIQPREERTGPPVEVFVIAPLVVLALLLPVSIAIARRLWKRGATKVAELPREIVERLTRLEQVGEATAIEIERIGEGQRFVTRLLTEKAERLGIGAP